MPITSRNYEYQKKYLDKDWLFEQYCTLNKSIKKIAEEQNTDWTVIKYWLKELQIPIKKYKYVLRNKFIQSEEYKEQKRKKLREAKLGSKNPMYTGFDTKMIHKVSKVTNCFNFENVMKNNYKCANGCEEKDVDAHHIIRQGTILKILQDNYPEQYKNELWVIEKYYFIHKEFSDIFLRPLCYICHNRVRKGYRDVQEEIELIKKLDFINQVKKIVENSNTQLGKKTSYITTYTPDLIFPVSRKESRERIGNIDYNFRGIDIWNTYEFSALDSTGKPYCKTLKIGYDCYSESIVESKSLKLYLNSFNQTKINLQDALNVITEDLSKKLKTNIFLIEVNPQENRKELAGFNLSNLKDISEFKYEYDSLLLRSQKIDTQEEKEYYYDSFKSNCRHSGLPDWATIVIKYLPDQYILEEESLLRYLVSFRNHKEFHEECVERVTYDIMKAINPKRIIVSCNYTRRGGIDINPIRIAGDIRDFDYKKVFSEFKRVNNQ